MTTAEQVPADRLVGQTLAERYQVLHRLGEGAMGVVYKARHVKVGRAFAVKVLHSRLLQDSKVAQRFDREAELAGRLRHANVIGVVDVGEFDGLRYMVMDFAEGPDLAQLLVEAPMPPARIIRLVRQMLEGLFHAHEQGLIHRDFKPENVIVERDSHGDEVPKIVDFGIAILRDGGDASDGQGRLTTNGLVLGTPHYMAPEQAVADPIDHRIDLFALGIVIYEMLSGRLPFDGSGAEVARANLLLDPPPISRRVPHLEVDPLLEAFARRMMAKKPKDRPANAKAARELLDLIEDDRPAAAQALGVSSDVGVREPQATETMATQPRPRLTVDPRVDLGDAESKETRQLRATPSPHAPFAPQRAQTPPPFAEYPGAPHAAPHGPFSDYHSAPHQAPMYGGYEQTPVPQAFPSYGSAGDAAPQHMPMAYSAPHLQSGPHVSASPEQMHPQTSVRLALSWPPKPAAARRKPPWVTIGVVAGSLGIALGAILALPSSKPEPVATPTVPTVPPPPPQVITEQRAPAPTPAPPAPEPATLEPTDTRPVKPEAIVTAPRPTPTAPRNKPKQPAPHVLPKQPDHAVAQGSAAGPLDPLHAPAPAPVAPTPAKPVPKAAHRAVAGMSAEQLMQFYREVGGWVFSPDTARLGDSLKQDLQTKYRVMSIQQQLGNQADRDAAAAQLDNIATQLGH